MSSDSILDSLRSLSYTSLGTQTSRLCHSLPVGRSITAACLPTEDSMSSTPRHTPVTLLQSLTLVLLSCSLAFGQSFTASVRGTAKDSSGGFLPLASVTITDAERGTSQTMLADEAGRFTITALPPGQYVLTVELTGFKKFSSGRFTLTVQQQATVDAVLEVGEVSETVEVSGAAAMVNTTIANLGQVIDNETLVSAAQHRAKPDVVYLPHSGRRRFRRACR